VSKFWAPDYPFAPRGARVFYGWVIVFGATLGTIFSIPGQTMGFSAFTEVLIRELELSRVQLSTAYLVGTFASGFSLPYLGRLLDRWGARRMIVVSAAATGLILIYLSFVAQLARAVADGLPASWRTPVAFGAIVLGFYLIRASAQGLLTMTSRNAIGKWFNVQRGLALAISSAVVSFGFAVAPRLLKALIEQWSYEEAWRFLALLMFGVMVPVGWLLFRDNPEECGLEMDNGVETGPTHPDMVIHREFLRGEAIRTVSFWAFNLSLSYFAMLSTAYTFHIESMGTDAGRSADFIFSLFIPSAVLSVLTTILCGVLSVRTRLKWLLLGMNLAAVTGTLSLNALESDAGVAAFVVGNGITGGCFVSLMGLGWPRYFGRKQLGAIAGLSMSSIVIASAVGPWLFALSRGWTGSYAPIVWICLAWPAACAVISPWANNPQRAEETSPEE